MEQPHAIAPATLDVLSAESGNLVVRLAGDWQLGASLPDISELLQQAGAQPAGTAIEFDTSRLGSWNTGLITTLLSIYEGLAESGVTVRADGLPEGAKRLIALSQAVAERTDTGRDRREPGTLEKLGQQTLDAWRSGVELITFAGELTLSLGRFATGRATYLRQNLFVCIQEAGAEALPIVALISLLIGMIFAFVGVMQLNLFGAGIYTADLVAVAMIREIAAIMTAIIMAGRTGAAYAAEIGTMKVNEEVDALTTLGINPVDFLVTPRVIALVLMMPLLTMFSSLMGIIGGMIVGLVMLDVSFQQYLEQTISSVRLNFLFGGLFKSLVYGSLVALAGTLQGMTCGSSAMAVGLATTRAVVMGIVLIVVSASVLTIIYINLGI